MFAASRRRSTNRGCGSLCLALTAACVVYYTAWALLTPFVPQGAAMLEWFPERSWAVRGPSLVLLAGLGTVAIFIGLTLRSDLERECEAS
ncbi:Dolichol phosphate-mannose biosynthesis regulatory protein [Thecaphora frezii]